MDAGAVTAPEQSGAAASPVLVAVLPHPGLLPEIAACYVARMSQRRDRIIAGIIASERDYIRREMDIFFSTLPRAAEGFHLKTTGHTWANRDCRQRRLEGPNFLRDNGRSRQPTSIGMANLSYRRADRTS
jgi:hypothetical protein